MTFPTSYVLVAALLFAVTHGTPLNDGPRIAVAWIYEHDGPWGSIVFKQASRRAPVQVQAYLRNVAAGPDGASVEWALHNEPVHYGTPTATRCSVRALRGISHGGSLHTKHGAISGGRLNTIAWDRELSLWDDEPGYVVQRSLAVRQGPGSEHHVCATVYSVRTDVAPGAVPCEMATYDDCVVAVGAGRCVSQKCQGLRQFWGVDKLDYKVSAVDASTRMCEQVYDFIPKITDRTLAADGTFACTLARYTTMRAL